MDIPIVRWTNPDNEEVKDTMVFCTDILDALTQDFFARKGNPIEEPAPTDEIKVQNSIKLDKAHEMIFSVSYHIRYVHYITPY